MKPELRRVGNCAEPGRGHRRFQRRRRERVASIAEALAPFPQVGSANYYPGVRRIITDADGAANAYVERTLRTMPRSSLPEHSTSMASTCSKRASRWSPPEPSELQLRAARAALRFHRPEIFRAAALPSRSARDGHGILSAALDRHRTRDGSQHRDSSSRPPRRRPRCFPRTQATSAGRTNFSSRSARSKALPDRLIIYQGSLLHSGIIPPGMNFSADPREGRLTANIFVRGH